jgi:hypothetical protein
MAVSNGEREAFNLGRKEYKAGTLGAVLDVLNVGRAFEHGFGGKELEAYRKGLSGESLDD